MIKDRFLLHKQNYDQNARSIEQFYQNQKCVDAVWGTLNGGGIVGNPINMMMSRNIRHF